MQKLLSNRSELYVSQGEISGGCATHSAAAALSVLGIINNPGQISGHRCERNGKRFWQQMKDAYADGLSLAELAGRLDALDFGLKITHFAGTHYRVLDFTLAALQDGHPVIMSFALLNRPRHHHAVLASGVSGRLAGRRFEPSAILITDSSETHPGIGPHNARLEFSPDAKRKRSSLYVTAQDKDRVSLTTCVSLRLTGSKRPDLKPP
ncbi:hypothetical protein E2553_40445 [Paraburkholderia dipogonis]|uniref:Peptidase C39-like domain-containing protein n=1 Tax=Paraburkholderia dipogonis TaxID=1211383 RepID=A0A4Y8MJU4_9BURK|nr:hypothetical protein [Paraburkholderia dipogonis]TFE37674.1 hypothetical protein E2553_40445 [Paraburkholderia dipogonis]